MITLLRANVDTLAMTLTGLNFALLVMSMP